jgi:alpha-galactosidase
MKALGDYLHGKGLKFGIYEAPLDKTCGQYFGSYPGATGSGGHETQDARQFAAWGVDYLKYDWCSPTGSINDQVTVFSRMRDALAATGRPIVYSINSNSVHAKTGPQRNWGDVANLWRTTEDIQNMWNGGQTNNYPMGVQNIVDVTVPLAGYAGPGHFNDPDMLEVGRGGGMNDTEMRSHFALWAMLAAPLLAGNDIRSMSAATKAILGNRNLIAIDQDSLGLQATQVSNDGTRRVLAKRLANGDVAVALFNQGGSTTTVSTTAAAIGTAGSSFTLLDAWTGGVSTTSGSISASVPAHGTVVYRVLGTGSSSPASPSSSPAGPSSSPAGPSSSPPPGGKTCTATYAVTGHWQGGFQAAVTVTAGAAPISSWTVTWQFTGGETVSQAWNATVTAAGSAVTAGNVNYNGSLNAGGSTEFGFLGAVNGAPGAPTPRCTAA